MEHKKDLRTVIITGGTKGIGANISSEFHIEWWFVAIAFRKGAGFRSRIGSKSGFNGFVMLFLRLKYV
jgi:NAD(P)-dependent dehydrogenase (short-subunit alcohol dehydrogenase family)|tara:strand:+ start:89 stop:292 length:204 start_codon:yes stop_codon:yes gene_type:complete